MKATACLLLALLVVAVSGAIAQETPPQQPPPEQPPPEQPAPPAAPPAPGAPAAPEAPPNPDLEQAKALFKSGDYAGAIAAAKRVLAAAPNDIAALYIAGVSEVRTGLLDDAATDLGALEKLEPEMPNLYFHLGHLAFLRAEQISKGGNDEASKARYLEAAKLFDTQLAKDPTHMSALSSRGLAYARAGDIDKAIAAYEAWIAVVPQSVAPYSALGSLYAELGRTADAVALVDRMPKDNPKGDADAAYGMAKVFYLNEKYADVLTLVDKVLQLTPDSTPAFGLKAMAYARMGDVDDTAQTLCKFIAMSPPDDVASPVGDVVKKEFEKWATTGEAPPGQSEGGGLTPPRLVKRVGPRYPPQARKDRVETQVMLFVVVLPDGSVGDTCLVPTSFWKNLQAMGLDKAAVDAVKKWKYEPGRKDGLPVQAYAPAMVNFTLR